jgi:hypothetical protein
VARVAYFVEAQRHKQEGHEFDSRYVHWFILQFTMTLEFTEPLIEIGINNLPGGLSAVGAQVMSAIRKKIRGILDVSQTYMSYDVFQGGHGERIFFFFLL